MQGVSMPADNIQLLRIYTNRLVKTLVPQDLGSDYIETIYRELIEFLEDSHQDKWYGLDRVLENFKNKFIATGNIGSWDQFSEAVESLIELKDPESIARYLVFLEGLKQKDQVKRNTTMGRITSDYIHINDKGSIGVQGDSRSNAGSFQGPTGAGDSFENINFDKFSDRRSLYSAAQNKGFQDSRNYTLNEVIIPYFENHVKEEDIMKYISFTLVGTTSNLFPLIDGQILIPDMMSNSDSGLLHAILECGLSYQCLHKSSEIFKSKRNSSAIKNGIMSYIFEELTDYMRLVNELSNKKSFSLRSLLSDLTDHIAKFRFLHYLTKKIENNTGDKLLSILYSYHNYGDTIIRDCAVSMLKYSLEPFSNNLKSWLLDGELKDKSDEFFIVTSSGTGFDGKNLSIKYVRERVPVFFPEDLSLKVYLIGKTNIFLKTYCKESIWCSNFSRRFGILLNKHKLKSESFYTDSTFHKLITECYSEITNYFTHVIYTKFQFMETIRALKDYLFMGKGDFIQNIILNGADVLNDPSNSLSGHQLTKILREAVMSTTVRHMLSKSDENNVVNNLDARLLEIGHGNIGWDVFTLDYQLRPPISLLLNNELNQHKKDYLRVFNYLWKFKRLESLFTDEWNKQRNFRKKNQKPIYLPYLKKMNRIRLIQNFLSGFSRSIERFIFTEIIDEKYGNLINELFLKGGVDQVPVLKTGSGMKIAKCKLTPSQEYVDKINNAQPSFNKLLHGYKEFSIDELENLHVEYLTAITKHKLINGTNPQSKGKISNKFYINQLNLLINLVFKFVVTVKEFNLMVEELETLSNFGEQFPDSEDFGTRMTIIYNNMLKIFNEFNLNFKVFITDLTNDDDPSLRCFGVTLNQ